MELSLSGDVELHMEYEDDSPFGTTVSGRLEKTLKERFRPAIEALRRDVRDTVERAPEILDRLGLDGSGEFFDASSMREELSFPVPSKTRPAAIVVFRGRGPVRLPVAPELAGDLAARIGEWQHTAGRPAPGPARDLWEALSELQCFAAPREPTRTRGAATFVGHATVLLSSPRTKILIDPFLMPRDERFPAGYQPLTHGDLAPDAILVTHSHMDHFHVDSLLRLGRDTPVLVPEVARESSLAVDMAYRLAELGFTAVRTLGWNQETVIGDFRVIALPMYGEQPTSDAPLPPDIRNTGNTYLIEGEGRRYAFVADAGRDHLGDVRSLATAAYERYGPLDVLFGGYRPWRMYPIQYLTSSVPQFLLYTPRSLWQTRQTIMSDDHALLDTAERWHARCVVPYANGGAPWYWQLGLGAAADGTATPGATHFDPLPEAVVRASAERSENGVSAVASPVRTLLMRPGESLEFDGRGEAAVVPNQGHVWPYNDGDALLSAPGSVREPMGLSRKRVLLRLLAKEEMRRRGLTVSTQQVADMSDDLRRQNGLTAHADMVAWLDRAGLGMAEYCEILSEWQGVLRLEETMSGLIEKSLAGQRAFATMRDAGLA
ncbi:MBL fold metallo-hydrolase [Streptomyces sp. NPDC004726]